MVNVGSSSKAALSATASAIVARVSWNSGLELDFLADLLDIRSFRLVAETAPSPTGSSVTGTAAWLAKIRLVSQSKT